MDWIVHTYDTPRPFAFTGSRDRLVRYLEKRHPELHFEAFTDEVLGYELDVAAGRTIGCDPVVRAVPA